MSIPGRQRSKVKVGVKSFLDDLWSITSLFSEDWSRLCLLSRIGRRPKI